MPFVRRDCICKPWEPCHFHSWTEAECVVCRWRAWVPLIGQTVIPLCREHGGKWP